MPGSREKNASEGFCFPGCLFFVQKDSGKPDSRAGARPLQRPYFLSTECASSRRVFISQNELSCEIKKSGMGNRIQLPSMFSILLYSIDAGQAILSRITYRS